MTYLDGAIDVSAAVTGAGYTIPPLAPGAERDLQVKVKVTRKAAAGKQLALLVEIGSPSVPD